MAQQNTSNRYNQIFAAIFRKYYQEGATEIAFSRDDIVEVSRELKIDLPKNLGDVIYSFRYRNALPQEILEKASGDSQWVIRPAGKARYRLMLTGTAEFIPSEHLVVTKIPDATPGIIERYAMNDEQALLARLRYNRLIDIFTGLTCYSLQNHLRTTIHGGSQVETDEVYVALDRRGVHYVLPVQAKSKKDSIGVVQIEQDFEMCVIKFPGAVCRSIAAQWLQDDVIALFEFVNTDEGVKIAAEKQYRLVPQETLSKDELARYSNLAE